MIKQFTSILLILAMSSLFGCSDNRGTGEELTDDETRVHQEKPTKGGIPWFDGSIEDAFAAAKAAKKPIFLYWGAEWCPPCHELKATIFLRDEFIEQAKQFVPVYLDGDTDRAQKYGERFGVYGYPTVIIFDPQGVELTRIPGGMNIEQYIGVLELALNAIHPVSDLLQTVQAGRDIRDEDWALLASYSWGQDRSKALGEQDKHNTFRLLAGACPGRLTVPKSKLQMLALAAWAGDEERDESLAQEYLVQLESVLADDVLSRENLNSFIYSGATMLKALPGDDLAPALRDSILEPLVAAIEDQSVSVLRRLDAMYGWVEVNKALLSEDEPLSPSQQAWVQEQAAAARAQVNNYQRHTAISTLWQLYYNADLETMARATLQEGMEVSDQPYYFMADMGYLEQKSGNEAEAIHWYKKAWDAARGPATRTQWGTNYLFALIELSPDDIDEIGAAGATIFQELAAQEDGLYHRSRGRMDRLSKMLLVWAEPAEGDNTTVEQRAVMLAALREEMDKLCVDVERDSEASATCESFLVASVVLPVESRADKGV
ncbi:MAG: thioredoxin family protein [Proteobacteria bacterium]|nr:thioredoxin family protein [Pseudomonadota bacterium]